MISLPGSPSQERSVMTPGLRFPRRLRKHAITGMTEPAGPVKVANQRAVAGRGVFAESLGRERRGPAGLVGCGWPSECMSRRQGAFCHTFASSGGRYELVSVLRREPSGRWLSFELPFPAPSERSTAWTYIAGGLGPERRAAVHPRSSFSHSRPPCLTLIHPPASLP